MIKWSLLMPASRWRLIRSLWMDRAEGSVRSHAKQAGVSYASAHAELLRLAAAGLACAEPVGNSLIYRANRDHRLAGTWQTMLEASVTTGSQDTQEAEIRAHLRLLGAPINGGTRPTQTIPAEETIARGLQLAHREPALARSFPVLLTRAGGRIELMRLTQRATALGEKQTLGFFLDLTGLLANDSRLRTHAKSLRDGRVRKTRDFFEGPHGKFAMRLAELRTPTLARDWKFRMDMSRESFEQHYRKFCGDS